LFALVLAGGKGERLRPLTADRPKPMVAVGDKPILQHHLEWLAGNGVSDAVLLLPPSASGGFAKAKRISREAERGEQTTLI